MNTIKPVLRDHQRETGGLLIESNLPVYPTAKWVPSIWHSLALVRYMLLTALE